MPNLRPNSNPNPYDLVRWALVQTSHAGNVGSSARALKTMGFSKLHLINPKKVEIANDSEAIALSSGAFDVLQSSKEEKSLDGVVKDCSLVLGLTSRDREFGPPPLTWKEAKIRIGKSLSKNQPVAIVFGPERTGLSNQDLAMCTHRVWLDANPEYPSLNLSQAVMVCAFAIREYLNEGANLMPRVMTAKGKRGNSVELADPAALVSMLEHWQLGLEAIKYLDPYKPKKLMERLQALFSRSSLHKEEIDLLRGIAKHMLIVGKAANSVEANSSLKKSTSH